MVVCGKTKLYVLGHAVCITMLPTTPTEDPAASSSVGDPVAPSVGDPVAPAVGDPVAPSVGDPVAPSVGDPVAPNYVL